MYGFHGQFDWQRFTGLQIVQVSFSQNTIDIDFDEGINIVALKSIELRQPGSLSFKSEVPGAAFSTLPGLVGRYIARAVVPDEQRLSLETVDGHELLFFDDTDQYEAFHVGFGGERFFI